MPILQPNKLKSLLTSATTQPNAPAATTTTQQATPATQTSTTVVPTTGQTTIPITNTNTQGPGSLLGQSHSSAQSENWSSSTPRIMNQDQIDMATAKEEANKSAYANSAADVLQIAGQYSPQVTSIGGMGYVSGGAAPILPQYKPYEIPNAQIGYDSQSYGYSAKEANSTRGSGAGSQKQPLREIPMLYAEAGASKLAPRDIGSQSNTISADELAQFAGLSEGGNAMGFMNQTFTGFKPVQIKTAKAKWGWNNYEAKSPEDLLNKISDSTLMRVYDAATPEQKAAWFIAKNNNPADGSQLNLRATAKDPRKNKPLYALLHREGLATLGAMGFNTDAAKVKSKYGSMLQAAYSPYWSDPSKDTAAQALQTNLLKASTMSIVSGRAI